MHRTACNSRPPGVSVDRLVYTLDHARDLTTALSNVPLPLYRPQIPTSDDALRDVRFTGHARQSLPFREETRVPTESGTDSAATYEEYLCLTIVTEPDGRVNSTVFILISLLL